MTKICRVGQHGPRERDELLLPGRQPVAALAHLGLVLVFQFRDEAVGADQPGGLQHFLVGGVEASVADVLPHAAAEEVRRLQHHAELRLQPLQAALSVVDAVDPDLPRRRLVEAAEQAHDRGLAAAGRADQGDRLARVGPAG